MDVGRMRAVMLNNLGWVRSCLITAEPTFPPGYMDHIDLGQSVNILAVKSKKNGGAFTPTTAMFFKSIIIPGPISSISMSLIWGFGWAGNRNRLEETRSTYM